MVPREVMATTRSGDWSKPIKVVSSSTVTPSSARRARKVSSTIDCGRISDPDGGISDAGRPLTDTRVGSAQPAVLSWSATPRSASTSRLRSCSPLPREPMKCEAALSMIRTRAARRARSTANVRPVGPAPAMSTSAVVGSVMLAPRLSLLNCRLASRWTRHNDEGDRLGPCQHRPQGAAQLLIPRRSFAASAAPSVQTVSATAAARVAVSGARAMSSAAERDSVFGTELSWPMPNSVTRLAQ